VKQIDRLVPMVSIGMPVYNNKDTISDAIESILNQSFSDFELIISDNASTDGTEDICRSYEKKDSRITYIRQHENTGTYNFIFLYEKAKGEFFMWAPSHYKRSLNFIEENIKILKENPNYTFSATPNCWIGDEEEPKKFYRFSFEGSAYERISKYLDLHMQAHACFYGLFRRSSMKGVKDLTNSYTAFDNAFIIQQLLKGEFGRSNNGLLIVGKGQSANPDYIGTFQTRPIHYILPYYDFSKHVIIMLMESKDILFKEKIILSLKILILNMKVYKMIIRYWLVKILKKVGIYEFIKKIKS
jgi:glycosyltransferase involved in cell wall biosynthesis